MKHGTIYVYSYYKCRCDLCRKAWNDYMLPRTRTNMQKTRERREAEKIGPCVDCGNTYPPECMDWDHRPEEEKLFSISSRKYVAEKKILDEIAKCDLVCANCHRIRTKKRKGIDNLSI